MPIDPKLPYDDQNVFAKILRSELPCNKVYEDEHALAFHDIRPPAPVHVLVIPQAAYVSWEYFTAKAIDGEIAGFQVDEERDLGIKGPKQARLADAGLAEDAAFDAAHFSHALIG